MYGYPMFTDDENKNILLQFIDYIRLISTFKDSMQISYFYAPMTSWACAIVTFCKILCNSYEKGIPHGNKKKVKLLNCLV